MQVENTKTLTISKSISINTAVIVLENRALYKGSNISSSFNKKHLYSFKSITSGVKTSTSAF